jgi:hydrogenase nickel incorporation protein HypA/HybF
VHEFSLMNDLMAKILTIADDNGGCQVTRVEVWLGALCHLSGPHFAQHFEQAVRGSVAEGASLNIEVSADIDNPCAAEVRLVSVDVAG